MPGEKLESLIKFSISSFCSDCVFSFKIFSQLSKLWFWKKSFCDLDCIVGKTFVSSSTIKKKYKPFGGSSKNFNIEFMAFIVSQLNLSIINTLLFAFDEWNRNLDDKLSICSLEIFPETFSSSEVI